MESKRLGNSYSGTFWIKSKKIFIYEYMSIYMSKNKIKKNYQSWN